VCPACLGELEPAADRPPPPGLDVCAALVAHRESGRDLVIGLKYRNRREAIAPVGVALAQLAEEVLEGRELGRRDCVPVVTWAPTTARRRRRRGYDQAELLARAIGRAGGVPVRRLLRRVPGPVQTGADRAHRLAAPHFRARGQVPDTVVLVDDVWTTGATLAAAAAVLRPAGATTVIGITLAARD
jgi:predicted amidophosphoribosyltransferase